MGSMNTFTGKRIDPLEMRAEDVCLEDLAHALSLLCRGGGICGTFTRWGSTRSTA